MIRQAILWSLVICISLVLLGSLSAFAQQWNPPPPEKRCPSPWGANDERGAANHMKPEGIVNLSTSLYSLRTMWHTHPSTMVPRERNALSSYR